ncbi:TetR/AcrR family transcriptional regulator [Paenibacillus nasutitermitis]|uniref:HTH tetR-type domain-containing protein n=1 Tax=Paenibacillus nasutitermitis TaxID=1652958 RepID=A0A916Z3W7_9BACL|nr:TetR/AcrR family transcriptional regulator [Paenibacillus nasutitermitis]GGD75602.1 hypothetical protein GCM10010911_36950 [Paenibacillus nasutitermitis]
MTSRRKKLTEEMKSAIRNSAARLFAEKGYQAVTMREIAKEAGCSHTAIYLYFKNKEDLLQQIAIPPLLEMEDRMLFHMSDTSLRPLDKLLGICREYAIFCLSSGSFFNVMITSASGRVDKEEPELEINVIRNRIFGHLIQMLESTIHSQEHEADPDLRLNRARILFYYMQGFVQTYTGSLEAVEPLLERTVPIYHDGIKTIVAGMKAR